MRACKLAICTSIVNFTGCDSDPCVKGDCSEDSQPLAHMGIDYLCACPDRVGGINCEIGKIFIFLTI